MGVPEVARQTMICVLCHSHDQHALWLAVQLRARGLPIEIVMPEELLIGSTLSLRLDTTTTKGSLRLARGVVIDDHCIGVINRLDALPPLSGESDNQIDAAYLSEEWRAAIVAWMATLTCPVLNKPSAVWLGGAANSDVRWRSLARQMGLAVHPWIAGSSQQGRSSEEGGQAMTFVVDGQVIGPDELLSITERQSIARLAVLNNLQLCSAEFDLSSDRPRLLRMNTFPPLANGGKVLVDAIEKAIMRS